ncbi:MAG: hypothetical protein ACFFD8_05850, partial [Candidatus Thorarchaeota archaeon]
MLRKRVVPKVAFALFIIGGVLILQLPALRSLAVMPFDVEPTSSSFVVPLPAPSHEPLPLQMLVYSEYADIDEEFNNTFLAINATYGTNYRWTNLTDYTNLAASLPGHEVLLIPEQELLDQITAETIGTAWSSTLNAFVSAGGVVIVLDHAQSGIHILDSSGLMAINSATDITDKLITVPSIGDGLTWNVSTFWNAPNNSLGIDTPATWSVAYYGVQDLMVHELQDHGHIVYLGCDFYERTSDIDNFLANAIRLHRLVLIDETHGQTLDRTGELMSWNKDLIEAGFGVSTMTSFSPTYINSSDVLVIMATTLTYSSNEIDAIETFVLAGGGLFLSGDWASFGDEIDDIANRFGFDFYDSGALDDSDDNIHSSGQVKYDGTNIITHPITKDVTRIEYYAGSGFLSQPSSSVNITVTDMDGTAFWTHDSSPAPGISNFAVDTYGQGRLAIIGDSNWFTDDNDWDSDGVNNYLDSNHSILACNTIGWLSLAFKDTVGPSISKVTHTPTTPGQGDIINITANAIDDSGVKNVSLYYRLNSGSWQQLDMNNGTGVLYYRAIGSFSNDDFIEYYIRAFDNSIGNYNTTTIVYSFTIANQPPTMPTLTNPGTIDSDGSFTVTWSTSTDPEGQPVSYQLQMSISSSFLVILNEWNTSATNQAIMDLSDGSYYFHVRAIDDHNDTSPWSNQESITVLIPNQPPTTPILNNPGTIDDDGNVTISWSPSTDSDGNI